MFKNIPYYSKLVLGSSFHQPTFLPNVIRPYFANIEVTENCNAKCITCDYWKSKKKDTLSYEQFTKIFHSLKNNGINNIRLTGGEALMRKDLFRVLQNFDAKDFNRVTLATNGLLLKNNLKSLNDSIITNLTVSLDGLNETNDTIRGVPKYFQRVTTALLEVNKPIKIVSTLTNRLIPQLREIIDFCKSKGYGFDVNLLDTNQSFFSSDSVKKTITDLMPNEAELETAFSILREHKVLSPQLLKSAGQYLKTGKYDYHHCMLGFMQIDIDAHANVRTGCQIFDPVGNLLEQELDNILTSEKYRRSVEKMFHFDCPGCTCGYGISALINKPIRGASYYIKRLYS
ncbi:MAG: radical SAM protein [Leptospirales bacterium]